MSINNPRNYYINIDILIMPIKAKVTKQRFKSDIKSMYIIK